jgi:hypothetical protein
MVIIKPLSLNALRWQFTQHYGDSLFNLDAAHWKKIARGPITLAAALNEHPVTYPGPV